MQFIYDPDSFNTPINPKDPLSSNRGLTGRERCVFAYIDYLSSLNYPVSVYSKFSECIRVGSVSYSDKELELSGVVVHIGKYLPEFRGKKNILFYPYAESVGTPRKKYSDLDLVIVPNDQAKWNISDRIYLNIEDINKFKSFKFSSLIYPRNSIQKMVIYSSRWDKGLKELLLAWAGVHKSHPDAVLKLPGLKNKLNKFIEWDRDHNIDGIEKYQQYGDRARLCKSVLYKLHDSGIEVMDTVSVHEVRRLIAHSACLVYPTNGLEKYSYHASSIADALGCGAPIIADGCPSLYDAGAKYIKFVNTSSITSLSQAISHYLSHPTTNPQIGGEKYSELHKIVMAI